MRHLHLLLPDPFPPRDIAVAAAADLRLPALQTLLGRAGHSTQPAHTLESWLSADFGAQAYAPVRAAHDGLQTGADYWFCADPVHLLLQRAQVLLIPDVVLALHEAESMCAALNAHFAGQGLRFHAPHAQRWYVQVATAPRLTTTGLPQAAWCDTKFHQPQGEDALHWQRILTEMQMVLYAHPLNQARAQRGETSVSSLWLWGGGQAQPLRHACDVAGGDAQALRAFAGMADVAYCDVLPLTGEYANGLWVCSAPREALQRGDVQAWRVAIQEVEQHCARPLLQALRGGELHSLNVTLLQADAVHCFELSRSTLWKLWRPARAWQHYAGE